MPNSTFWKKFFLVLKVIEVRLRFIAILVITALAIGYWDTITNYWDKWTRSAPTEIGKLAKDEEFYCPMHPQVVRDDFDPNGQTPHCPICGMPLSLRKKGAPSVLPHGVTARESRCGPIAVLSDDEPNGNGGRDACAARYICVWNTSMHRIHIRIEAEQGA